MDPDSPHRAVLMIGHIISPSSFKAREFPVPGAITKEIENLQRIEESLSSYCNKGHADAASPTDKLLAVKREGKSKVWDRAELKLFIDRPGNPLADVYLLDQGIQKRVPLDKNVVALSPEFGLDVLSPFAVDFELYGLSPTNEEIDFIEERPKQVLSPNWSPLALVLTQDLIRLASVTYGDIYDVIKDLDGVRVLGDIIIHIIESECRFDEEEQRIVEKYDDLDFDQPISLRQILLERSFCIDVGDQAHVKSKPRPRRTPDFIHVTSQKFFEEDVVPTGASRSPTELPVDQPSAQLPVNSMLRNLSKLRKNQMDSAGDRVKSPPPVKSLVKPLVEKSRVDEVEVPKTMGDRGNAFGRGKKVKSDLILRADRSRPVGGQLLRLVPKDPCFDTTDQAGPFDDRNVRGDEDTQVDWDLYRSSEAIEHKYGSHAENLSRAMAVPSGTEYRISRDKHVAQQSKRSSNPGSERDRRELDDSSFWGSMNADDSQYFTARESVSFDDTRSSIVSKMSSEKPSSPAVHPMETSSSSGVQLPEVPRTRYVNSRPKPLITKSEEEDRLEDPRVPVPEYTRSKAFKLKYLQSKLKSFGRTSDNDSKSESSGCESAVPRHHRSRPSFHNIEGTSAPSELPVLVEFDPAVRRRPRLCANVQDILVTNHSALMDQEFVIQTRKRTTVVQQAMWPVVPEGHSTVTVSMTKNGKTIGYLLPLIHQLLTEKHYPTEGGGPIIVVLASSWKAVEEGVNWNITKLTEGLPSNKLMVPSDKQVLTTITSYNQEIDDRLICELTNGCHILTATPMCFLRLLKMDLTNLRRCCHLVLEDGDELILRFKSEVLAIARLFDEVHQQSKGNLPRNQIILTSDKWTQRVKEFVKECMDKHGPTFIFANTLELIAFTGIQIVPSFCDSREAKVKKVQEILTDERTGRRVMIFCEDSSSCKRLATGLARLKIPADIIDESESNISNEEKRRFWQSNPSKPLIVSDGAQLERHRNVDAVVHFDIPSSSKAMFVDRHYHLKLDGGYYKAATEKRLPQSFVLITKENITGMRRLYPLLIRLGCEIPDDLATFYKKSAVESARIKQDFHICSGIKTRGLCRDPAGCPMRHFLHPKIDLEHPNEEDIIVFSIVHVEEPNRYFGRIAKIVKSDGSIEEVAPAHNLKRSVALANLKQDSLSGQSNPKVGQLYIVRNKDEACYERAEVLQVVYDCHRKPEEVKVLYIDKGEVNVHPVDSVYNLPDELNEERFPRSAVEVILTRLVPRDRDPEWTRAAHEYVFQRVNNREAAEEDHVICRGQVMLHLDHTYWLRQVQVLQQLESTRWTPIADIKKALVDLKLADDNPDHITNLKALCDKAQIRFADLNDTLSTRSESWRQRTEKVTPQYAFLDRSGSVHPLWVTEVYDPDRFFVRQDKFSSQLSELEREMQEFVDRQRPDDEDRPEFEPGDLCIVQDDETSSRGRVLAWNEDELFKVFCVDHGYTLENIPENKMFRISPEFIRRLPFQAIECKLHNVKPAPRAPRNALLSQFMPRVSEKQKWTRAAGDRFYELVEETLMWGVVWARMEVKSNPWNAAGKKYVVSLTKLNALAPADAQDQVQDGHAKMKDIGAILCAEGSAVEIEKEGEFDMMGKDELAGEMEESIDQVPSPKKEKPLKGDGETVPMEIKDEAPLNRPIALPKIPSDLPSLSFREDIVDPVRTVPSVEWSQKDKTSITFKINMLLAHDLIRSNVYLDVTDERLAFEYMEVKYDADGLESYVFHTFTPFSFHGSVVPSAAKVKYFPMAISVTLKKVHPVYWKWAATAEDGTAAKFPWLKSAEVKNQLSSDDEDEFLLPAPKGPLPFNPVDESSSELGETDDEDGPVYLAEKAPLIVKDESD